jgi:hypothetical protein
MHFFLPALAFIGAASAQFLISQPLPYQVQAHSIVKTAEQVSANSDSSCS